MSSHSDPVLEQALSAHQEGRLQEAERLYRRVLTRQPRNFTALRFLGVLAGHAGQWQEGIRSLREAVKVDPKSAEAHTDLGAMYHGKRDFEKAAQSLLSALRLNAAYGAAHHNLGVVRRDQGRFAEAAASFGAAVGLKPDVADGWFNLGVVWQAQGLYRDAVWAYGKAAACAPGRLDINCAKGALHFEMGDYDDAAAAYRAALEVREDHPDALNGWAASAAQLDETKSIPIIERAIDRLPNNIYAHDLLGNVHRRAGRMDAAVAAYETAIGLPGNHAHSFYGLTHAKKIRREDEHLISRMREELQTRHASLTASDRSFLHFALGKALDDLDRCEEAMVHFDLANRAWLDARPPHRRVPVAEERRRHRAEIDAIMASLGGPEIAHLQRWGSSSERPVLIVGMMRSGTSLVEQILASHPGVGGAGELTFWNECRLRLRIGSGTPLRAADVADMVRDYGRVLDGVSTEALRVTDKMPHNFLLLGLIHGIFPRARIIHCRRHPIDTCLSIYFNRFAKEQDFAYDRSSIVFFYQEYRRMMAHWRRVIPAAQLLDVDYEALVGDQEQMSRRIVEFCGLDWAVSCLSFHETTRPVRTVSAWQVRQPLYRTSAERWRRYEPWLGEFAALAPT